MRETIAWFQSLSISVLKKINFFIIWQNRMIFCKFLQNCLSAFLQNGLSASVLGKWCVHGFHCVKCRNFTNFLVWKLCLSTKFPHQEIRWNYGILRSVCNCIIKIKMNKKIKIWMENQEAVAQRCSVKGLFLSILQNLQRNTFVGVSFLIKLRPQAQSLRHKCFPVNFTKSFRIHFL